MSRTQDSMNPVILSMEVDDEDECESKYRLRIGNQIKYIDIAPGTLNRDILSFPLASLPSLPHHDDSWTIAHISRDAESGELKTSLSNKKLAGVQSIWHPTQINVLDLKRTEQLTGAAFEALINKSAIPGPETAPLAPHLPSNCDKLVVIAKIARFDWEIPRIERETRAYLLLQQHHVSDIAPRFLGHIHEGGRVMGLLLEKLESRHDASINDLSSCKAVLGRFHGCGLLHGDVNRYNFLVGQDEAKIIDFEHFQENASEKEREMEMKSLRNCLVDESGRGGGFIFSSGEE